MQRRITVLSVLCVVLAFLFAVSMASPVVLAETTSSSVSKKSNDEQPYEEPTTKAAEPSSKPTESSSKPTEPSSKPTEPSSKPTEPSSKPTEPSSDPTNPTNPTSPTDPTNPTNPTSQTDPTDPTNPTSSTNKSDSSTTTKKQSSGKTTTRKYTPVQTTKSNYTKMVVPQVENTTQEGGSEALDPLDAYFERISGNPTEAADVTEATTEAQQESETKLSTAAIVAICLIAIALVVVVLTVIFAVRNKRAEAQDGEAPDYDVGYDADDDIYADPAPKANDTPSDDVFTVVSLDDKSYKD